MYLPITVVGAGPGSDQVPSPLKKVVVPGVPVAHISIVMVPAVVIVPPVTDTKVPDVVAIDVTVPMPSDASMISTILLTL